jgi:hypothetical protein
LPIEQRLTHDGQGVALIALGGLLALLLGDRRPDMRPALLAVLQGSQQRFQRPAGGDRGREASDLGVQASQFLAQRLGAVLLALPSRTASALKSAVSRTATLRS